MRNKQQLGLKGSGLLMKKSIICLICMLALLCICFTAYADHSEIDLWVMTKIAEECGYSDYEWYNDEDNCALLSVIIQTALCQEEDDVAGYSEGAYIGYNGSAFAALIPKDYGGTYWVLFTMDSDVGYYSKFSQEPAICAAAIVAEGLEFEFVEIDGSEMFAGSGRYRTILEQIVAHY